MGSLGVLQWWTQGQKGMEEDREVGLSGEVLVLDLGFFLITIMAENNQRAAEAFKRFDMHIYDYMRRRGFNSSANALIYEAGLAHLNLENGRLGNVLINLGPVIDDLYTLMEALRTERDPRQRHRKVNQVLSRLFKADSSALSQGSNSNRGSQTGLAIPGTGQSHPGLGQFQSISPSATSGQHANYDLQMLQNISSPQTPVEREFLSLVGNNTQVDPQIPPHLFDAFDDITELRLCSGDWTTKNGCSSLDLTEHRQQPNQPQDQQSKENGRKRNQPSQSGSGIVCGYDNITWLNNRASTYNGTSRSGTSKQDFQKAPENFVRPNRKFAFPSPSTMETNVWQQQFSKYCQHFSQEPQQQKWHQVPLFAQGHAQDLGFGINISREDKTSVRTVLKREEDELLIHEVKAVKLEDQKQKQLLLPQQSEEGRGKQLLYYGSRPMTWSGNASGCSSDNPSFSVDGRSSYAFFSPGSSSKRHKGDDDTDGEPSRFSRRL